ncbi:MAG: Aldo/keto reductase, partial [uncultured Corynebacteriales bacterium]
EIPAVRPAGLAGLRGRVRHVGHRRRRRRLDRCRRRDRGVRPAGGGGRRLHVLRHRVGLRPRAQRGAARRAAGRQPRPPAVRGDEGPAQGPPLAVHPAVPARRRVPARPHRGVRPGQPGQPRGAADRPPPVPRLGGRLGRRPGLAPPGGAPARRGGGRRGRDQRQPVGAGERAEDPGDRPDRRRPGHLQHLRPGAGGRAVPGLPGARRRGDRQGAVRRGHPDRDADPGHHLAAGRLAGVLLRAGEPAGQRRARRAAAPAGAGRLHHAGAGAAVRAGQPGRGHGDPGDALGPARTGQPRGQRRHAAGPGAAHRPARAPLGPRAHRVVPV